MKATGIVRRIDDLGRVVIPKEIRRTLRIREGDPLEIFTDREGEIILKKYSPIGELGTLAKLYAESLSRNTSMLRSIAQRVQDGLPTVAECGGFLYLGKTLEEEDGKDLPMAGVLPGEGKRQKRLVRFGYARLTAKEDSLLFRAGEEIPIHEFHYWDSTENGEAFEARKPVTGRSWECGFATPTLYAGFPHLYFAGNPRLAQRFADAAAQYQEKQKGD